MAEGGVEGGREMKSERRDAMGVNFALIELRAGRLKLT